MSPVRWAARAATSASVLVIVMLAAPGVAAAIDLEAGPAGAGVCARAILATGEPTGTVVLEKDDVGCASASRTSTAAETIEWPFLATGYGTFRFRALVQHATGTDFSGYVTVTVTPPAPPPSAPAGGEVAVPTLISPSAGLVAKSAPVKVRVGPNTTRLEVYLNGRFVTAREGLRPDTLVQLAILHMPKGSSTIRIVASNGGSTAERSWRVRRVEHPYPTCIVIDKSDYRLYWVRNSRLVKSYGVAHGRNNCTPVRTWRILAKYRTSPGGVYGPRKMRLFKRTRRGWAYTAYGIHGTNQPWVIGTQASHGCIRMYNRDVLELWPQVPLGTHVITRP